MDWLQRISEWEIGESAEVQEHEEDDVRRLVVSYMRSRESGGRKFRMKSHPYSGGFILWREQ
jgi:hypothetical protein